MPDVPITLVPWFEAEDNPPEFRTVRYVDAHGVTGFGCYSSRTGLWHPPSVSGPPLRHQPVRWCDPSPPDMSDPNGPLTAGDLRLIHDYLGADEEDFPENLHDAIILAQTRLRRALAAIQKGGT